MSESPEMSEVVSATEITLNLPMPPSANHYRGRRIMFPKEADVIAAARSGSMYRVLRSKTFVTEFLTEQAKKYREDVASLVLLHGANKKLADPIRLEMRMWPPDRRKLDLSNIYKCVEDALQHAGVFLDDYQICEHLARRET